MCPKNVPDGGSFVCLQDPNAYQQLIQKAEDFIAQRALRHIGNVTPQPVVHIVKVLLLNL